jgi:hypothetical protein
LHCVYFLIYLLFKMTRLFLLLAFILGSFVTLFAQQRLHRCGYDHAVQQRNQQFPRYKQQIDNVFDAASKLGMQQQYQRTVNTIPVAVHVVWKTPDQRLSECEIIEQIEVLNEDFRRQNLDASNLRPIFNSIAADTEIDFRLDSIIWTQSNIDFGTLGPFGGLFPDPNSIDSVKSVCPGLDPNQYLNIWITNLGAGGLLGYAYPPDSLPNWPAGTSASSPDKEGVVLHYEIVGRSNSVTFGGGFGAPPTTIQTQGRTATHEVGHYLGLRHIWGDGAQSPGSPFPQPSCSVDDGVGDTPNCLDRSEFDCDTTKNSCDSTLVGDMPDMIENYMDYSAESCMNTFTVGQKNLMKGVLNGPRAGLSTTPVKTRPNNDAILNAQNLLVSATCANSFSASTTNASISLPFATSCNTTSLHDVWFSFTATSSSLDLEFSNIVDNNGGTANLGYEVFEGSCDSLVSITCDSATTLPLTNLLVGEMYYVRAYSLDNMTSHDFDVCLRGTITNTEEFYSNNSISIYPNPTTSSITVELENKLDITGHIELKNYLGQSISNRVQIDSQDNQVQISLQNQPNGIYLVELVLESGQTLTKKVVLQR